MTHREAGDDAVRHGGGVGRRRLRVGLAVLLLAGLAAVVYQYRVADALRNGLFDLGIYRDAVRYWLAGNDLYDFARHDLLNGPLGFTYPPFAAFCLVPLALLPASAAQVSLSLLTVAATAVTTWWLLAPVARRRGWPVLFPVALATVLAMALDPTRQTVGMGQINMLLVLLVLLDVLVLLPRGSRWAGIGIGIATAVKLLPGIFIVYLLVTRRWRAAFTAMAAAAAATAVGVLVAPSASWRYWTETLWETGRVGQLSYTSNQSLLGILSRLADPEAASRLLWIGLVCVVVAVGMWRARQAAAAGDEVAGVTLAGLVGLLVSPVTWVHHMYWVVPAIIVLVDAGWDRSRVLRRGWLLGLAVVTYAAFAYGTVWKFEQLVGNHHLGGLTGVLGENAYVLLTVALLAFLPSRRTTESEPDPERVTLGAGSA